MKSFATFVIGLCVGFAVMPVYRRTIPRTHVDPVSAGTRICHAAFMRQLTGKSEVTCVVLGDSITHFWVDVPDLWGKHFPDGSVNFGVPGNTVEDVQWRVDNGELDGYSASNVVLLIGVNNIIRGDNPELVAAAIAKLTDTIKAKQPSANVVLLGILPCGRTPDDPRRVSASLVNARLSAAVDCDSAFVRPDGTIDAAIMPDFVHLSAAGYDLLGSMLSPHLK